MAVPRLRRSAALVALGATALAGLAPALPATAVELPSLVVNEVESDGGTPGDWVELTNTGTATVDASGMVLKDNDDTHAFTVPAGTSIAPGAFWVADVDTSFGLGKADSARLFTADGTLLDTYSWASHAPTSYGRCPDGTGAFQVTTTVTRGAANDCGTATPADLRINEVESSGGTPGDWLELVNTGTAPLDASGMRLKDNDDAHAFSVIPDGTVVAAGGFYVVEESALGFGLGGADSARLYAADGLTLVDSYSWTVHAATTYGRCPDGTGAFTTTTTATKGTANDCSTPVRLNEVESSGGTPGDWLELVNTGTAPVDLTGWTIKDNDDAHVLTVPAGTSIAAGGYWAADVEQAFGLGSADSARLFDGSGALVDSYSWTAHAATTYGRCPDGTGAFTTTTTATKGSANACPGDLVTSPWPGGDSVRTVDRTGFVAGNLSGLDYQPSGTSARGTLWAVQNGPGTLFKLVWDGTDWVPADGADWAAGKALHFPDGTGNPDAEGVALGPDGAVYASIERNNDVSGTSRLGVLRFDPSTAGTSLTATTEWTLVSDLPPVAANSGLEAITWVPDSYLTSHGFVDQRTGSTYDPASYPGHGTGLFLVGLEANGHVYAYALDADGSYARVADVATGFTGVMDLQYDPERQQVWAVCDDTCNGRSAVLSVAGDGPQRGHLTVDAYYERPAAAPNLNNEGFAVAPQDECVDGRKPVYWSDDSATDGHSLREGSIACTVPVVAPEISAHVVGTAGGDGWYRSATVEFSCTEHSAPLAEPCPAAVVLADGADQHVSATVTATDGGTATATLTGLDVDGTAPAVAVGGVVDGTVYLGAAPRATCAGSDALSGLSGCTVSTVGNAGRTTVTATATDVAGNTSTAVVTYQVLTTYVRGATYRDGVFEVRAGQRYTVETVSSTPALLLGPIGSATTGPWFRLMTVRTVDGLRVASAPVTVSRGARVGSTSVALVTTGRSTTSVVLRTVR